MKFDVKISAGTDAETAMQGASLILAVIPAQSLRPALEQLAPAIPADVPLVLCAKGIERASGKLLSQVAAETSSRQSRRRPVRPKLCARCGARTSDGGDGGG